MTDVFLENALVVEDLEQEDTPGLQNLSKRGEGLSQFLATRQMNQGVAQRNSGTESALYNLPQV